MLQAFLFLSVRHSGVKTGVQVLIFLASRVLYRCRDDFILMRFPDRSRVHFFCTAKRNRTKEKAARMTCPANNAGYPCAPRP